MTLSKTVFYFCVAFLFGVFIASFFNPGFLFYFLILIFGILLFCVFYPYLKIEKSRKKFLPILGLCLFLFLFGVIWEEKFEREIIPAPNKIHYFNNKGKFLVEGIVTKEPQEKENNFEAVINVQKVKKDNKEIKASGNLLVFLKDKVNYGDKVILSGVLEEPKNFTPDFNYKEYLRARRIYSLMFNPEIKILSYGNGNLFLGAVFSFKEILKEKAKIFPGDEGAILSAITIGDKTRLSKEFKEKLSIVGLSHIVAISGMHIMIILEIFFLFFILLGFWRREATIIALFFLFFYVLLIGAPASAIRAGIMGALLYIGFAIGRLSESSRSVVFAASFMVAFNPLILTRDVGFQLSFLAAIGIIYFYPILKEKFNQNESKIKDLIFLTLSAQVLCLPILIFNFGKVPILAPLSNILVVPFLPALLIGGFLFLILSLVLPYFSLYFSFLIKIIFSWVVFVVNFISSFSFSSLSLKISPIFILIFYFILLVLMVKIKKQKILAIDSFLNN